MRAPGERWLTSAEFRPLALRRKARFQGTSPLNHISSRPLAAPDQIKKNHVPAASCRALRSELAACGRGPRRAMHGDSAQRGRARCIEPAPTRIGAPLEMSWCLAPARWSRALFFFACARALTPGSPPHPRQDIKRKAVMVAATGQHHGKTTVTLGMVQALLARKWKVAYQKPVGQQTGPATLSPSSAVR
jgi:hypothetical protein